MDLIRIQVIARSQYSITAQVKSAEDYECVGRIANECQYLSNHENKPVYLIGKHEHDIPYRFYPRNITSLRKKYKIK